MSSSTALVAISKKGAELALALSGLTGEQTVFLERRWHVEGKGYQAFDLPLRPVIQRLFNEYQRLVLFMPLGAAVRLLAPYIQDKHDDPAVVCVDDAGRFAVSLLSGHLGGADALAQEVAMLLGATPVVTSASHVAGTLAVDLLGQEFGWVIDSPRLAVTRASAAVVNGEPVGVYQQAGEPDWWPEDRPLPKNIIRCSNPGELAAVPGDAALIISDYLNVVDREDQPPQQVLRKQHLVVYRPRSLVIGMGCRRGVPLEELEELLLDTLRRHNLAPGSVSCLATADLKQDEAGLIELAAKYDVPLTCYSGEELNQVFQFSGGAATPSATAHKLLGIWGVSEPAALLASGSEQLLVPREKTARATIAIARRNYESRQA